MSNLTRNQQSFCLDPLIVQSGYGIAEVVNWIRCRWGGVFLCSVYLLRDEVSPQFCSYFIEVMDEAKDSVNCIQVTDHEILTGSVDGRIRRYDLRKGEMIVDNIGSEWPEYEWLSPL